MRLLGLWKNVSLLKMGVALVEALTVVAESSAWDYINAAISHAKRGVCGCECVAWR